MGKLQTVTDKSAVGLGLKAWAGFLGEAEIITGFEQVFEGLAVHRLSAGFVWGL